ncbi:MAG: alpha-amylase family glycosyl hydrolase, partial [Lutibacter sp.]|nr:alpha-amylase family glycosyl hydrolase [Lutibacter sp.]
MKSFKIYFQLLLLGIFFLVGCSNENLDELPQLEAKAKLTTNQTSARTGLKPIGSGVMMQAFYWDVPSGGNWWNTVKGKVQSWSDAGIDAVWLPPASKAQNGAFSMGYDPFDYYDFGQYNQMGSLETRFGSLTELQALINASHTAKLSVIADIVINHNSGGQSEI